MTSEFPLLSAVLEQSLDPLSPAGDVGRVLGALGIADSSYHSFEPLPTPEAPPVEAGSPTPLPAKPAMTPDHTAVEPAEVELVARQPVPTASIHSGHAVADPLWPEPKQHEPTSHGPFGEAPVWTTPTLGIPTRTEPRVMAHATPAPLLARTVAERAPTGPAWNRDQPRHPAPPEPAGAWPASPLPPGHDNPAASRPPTRQTLSLSALFRILGSPTQPQASPSRTLRDVFGYNNNKRDS